MNSLNQTILVNFNMKIVLSSNCQTGGIAAALKLIFPSYELVPIPTPNEKNISLLNDLKKHLLNANIWVKERNNLSVDISDHIKIINLPTIYFNAFHPDITYAKIKPDGDLTFPHYNSKIAIWLYQNNIEIKDGLKLYNDKVYNLLGYYEYWYSSVNNMKHTFKENGLEERDLIQMIGYLKRMGLFMHTVNHPLPIVLTELAKIIAKKIDSKIDLYSKNLIINDTLSNTIWPLYPEIGAQLGLKGNYSWRIENKEIEGISNYLEYTFNNYSNNRVNPNEICSIPNFIYPPSLNEILFEELK